jgi:hypothetical protein
MKITEPLVHIDDFDHGFGHRLHVFTIRFFLVHLSLSVSLKHFGPADLVLISPRRGGTCGYVNPWNDGMVEKWNIGY